MMTTHRKLLSFRPFDFLRINYGRNLVENEFIIYWTPAFAGVTTFN